MTLWLIKFKGMFWLMHSLSFCTRLLVAPITHQVCSSLRAFYYPFPLQRTFFPEASAWVSCGCYIIKCHILGGSNTRCLFFTVLEAGKAEVKFAARFGVWGEPSSWDAESHSLTESSYGRERGDSSLLLFLKSPDPNTGTPSSRLPLKLINFSKALPPKPISLGIRASTHGFWGDTFSL